MAPGNERADITKVCARLFRDDDGDDDSEGEMSVCKEGEHGTSRKRAS